MKRTTTRAGRNAEAALREFALGFPETHEDFPWGHIALKVRRKVFLFLGGSESGGLSLSVKLTASHTSALDRAFASPTGYGLGKHGWVSAQFEPDDVVPLDLLRTWIDESYRAIAPKKLVATLSNAPVQPAQAKRIKPTTGKSRGAAGRKKSRRRKAK